MNIIGTVMTTRHKIPTIAYCLVSEGTIIANGSKNDMSRRFKKMASYGKTEDGKRVFLTISYAPVGSVWHNFDHFWTIANKANHEN